MKKFFEQQKGNLGSRPATISFRQIVVAPKASAAAKARARAQADSIVLELRQGADFATAARRFSQDPGSKDQGGSLNWFRRGVMVPEFERVAFGLKPGVVSDPVESPVRLSHHPGGADPAGRGPGPAHPPDTGDRLRQRGQSAPRAGGPSPRSGDARARHSIRCSDSTTTRRAASARPTTYRPTSCPRTTQGHRRGGFRDGRPSVHAQGRGRSRPVRGAAGDRAAARGEIRYEDVKDRIRQQLGQELAIRRYIDQLRKSTYVEMRI